MTRISWTKIEFQIPINFQSFWRNCFGRNSLSDTSHFLRSHLSKLELCSQTNLWQFFKTFVGWIFLKFPYILSKISKLQPTRKSMSKRERHLRMLEKLGLRSIFFLVKTKTQRMFPEKGRSGAKLSNVFKKEKCTL